MKKLFLITILMSQFAVANDKNFEIGESVQVCTIEIMQADFDMTLEIACDDQDSYELGVIQQFNTDNTVDVSSDSMKTTADLSNIYRTSGCLEGICVNVTEGYESTTEGTASRHVPFLVIGFNPVYKTVLYEQIGSPGSYMVRTLEVAKLITERAE